MTSILPGNPFLPAGLRVRDLEPDDSEQRTERAIDRGDMLRDFDKGEPKQKEACESLES